MSFRFFYGSKPKLTQRDAENFSRNGYECNLLLQEKSGKPVAVCRNKELDIWKVQYGCSQVFFSSYAEALAFCKGRFFDLDGKMV